MSALALAGLVAAQCSGKSDACSKNPVVARRSNAMNYHPETCDLKWNLKCTDKKNGQLEQKPPPYFLCTTYREPSGLLPVDFYTLSMQINNFAPGAAKFTMHGLWPGSAGGDGPKNQPYGCQNGEEFDTKYLDTFNDLLKYYWPTDPQYKNTLPCFILSEWMKHGTCAVITGADGESFRLSQETYYRTVFVMANEYNSNVAMRQLLQDPRDPKNLDPLIGTGCVSCAYQATVGWTGTDVESVPRMSSSCVDQCFACGTHWSMTGEEEGTCSPAMLDSTIELDPSNAPLPSDNSDGEDSDDSDAPAATPVGEDEPLGFASNDASWIGTWRSFGAEQGGSGKFEFAQTFTDKTLTVTTDSPYPSKCTYEEQGPGQMILNCGPKHVEDCLVQRLPDIDGLNVAFLACNHTGLPAPGSFYSAMDTVGCGNFLMFRCKPGQAGCAFKPDAISAKESNSKAKTEKEQKPVSHSQPGVAGAPPTLLGSWRTLQVSSNYEEGLARWNFTANGQATVQWPNYLDRGVKHYSVSHSKKDPSLILLASHKGEITTCHFKYQYHSVYSYATLDCGEEEKGTKWAMGRCNPCSSYCRYSCDAGNRQCGAGSCDPAKQVHLPPKSVPESIKIPAALRDAHDWCTPDDPSCWPTEGAIFRLEQKLDPYSPRRGLHWNSFPQPQPAPVPLGSNQDQSFYGLGASPSGVKALYYYENLDEMQRPCFTPGDGTPSIWNTASDMCKAALHQNEYRNWNPFIVVFPLNERHVEEALIFAANHRLCIAVAGTGHEYNSRNSCPTGGILIRMILFKGKEFLPTWREQPAIAPAGAFRFGAGSIFSEMHSFSEKYDRLVASGWCSTVGMVGFHLGGGHGPFGPSSGLGVDNLLQIEVLQVGNDPFTGAPVVHKKIASRVQNPQLFWAMRGGGGGVWGVILSMTIRAHNVPDGGLSRVFVPASGTFCEDDRQYGYKWLRGMWSRFAEWQLVLNQKVSTQPGFFINTTIYKNNGEKDLCDVTWQFNFEYFYAGGQKEPEYAIFRDRLRDVVLEADPKTVQEDNYKSAYQYLLTMPANKFSLGVNNPLPAAHPPSDDATGSQNSVLVSRQAMETQFASTMMDVLGICVETLRKPDMSSTDPAGYRCGFHYLYASLTGNLGSVQPDDTAISPGFRSAIMLWNARTLTTKQSDDTIYKLGPNSYFSESSYVLHNWTDRYWGQQKYEQLLAVKKAHDPGNLFWCHHCIGDDPGDAYGDPLGIYAVDDFVEKDKKDKKGKAYERDEL